MSVPEIDAGGVVDWRAKAEPWRSIGLRFRDELRAIMAGYVQPVVTVEEHPGVRLRRIRKLQGLTFQALARRAGCSISTVRGIEVGGFIGSRQKRLDIAQALGVEAGDIWPDLKHQGAA